ncbi:microsomal glutathione S-transferase 1-like [Ptychodera flava]|uniref:microsomal glutathione S-transferase 1-like n=1 Tax=Ptychodera flava TaxID=63121 RepID=UPI00396A5AA3
MVAELNFNNPTVVALARYGALVVGKMLFLLLLTSFFRVTRKVFSCPEDARSSYLGNAKTEDQVKKMLIKDDMIERVRRCVLNDMENIIPFLLLAPLYILTGPADSTALLLFQIFVGSRFVHTITYLFGMQPFRALAFTAGLCVNFYFVFHIFRNSHF